MGSRDSGGTPVISVVLCVRNGMPLLTHQLSALAHQDYAGSWELVIVDNGCADGSVDAAMSFATLPSLTVANARSQAGLSFARNIGAGEAKGTTLLFCDADDVVSPDWVSAAVRASETSNFFGGRLKLDAINDSAVTGGRRPPTPDGLPTALGYRPYAVGANFGVSRDFYHSIGGFDESFTTCCDDVDFSWRAAAAGQPPSWAPDVVVDYRLRRTRRAVWRQAVNYGRGERLLRTKHRGVLVPDNRSDLASELALLLSRIPMALCRQSTALWWLAASGRRYGQLTRVTT